MASSSKSKGAVKTRSWAKHLRKDGKREQNKAVRRDSKTKIKEEDEQSKKGSKPDYIDLDKDGNKKESMKKAAQDKKKKKIVKESALLVNFIKCIAEEKYAEANKYLQQAIHSKLEAKIAQSIKPTLF